MFPRVSSKRVGEPPVSYGQETEHHSFLWDYLRGLPYREPDDSVAAQASLGLLEIAENQGIDRLLMEWLWRHTTAVEPPLHDRLQERKLYVLGQALSMEAALAECLVALAEAGVPAMPIKGVALAHRIYDEVWMRPTSDTDILIHRPDYDRALDALAGLGYVPDDSPIERFFLEKRHNAHLRAPKRPVLELHVRLCVAFGARLETERVWGNPESKNLPSGQSYLCMEPEVEMTYLALHSAIHLFNRWIWLYDLKLFALRHPELDWSRVEFLARDWGVTEAVMTALHYAREMGAPIPNRLSRHQVRRHLMEYALQVGFSGQGVLHTTARLTALGLLCTGSSQRLRWARTVAEEVGTKRGLLGR